MPQPAVQPAVQPSAPAPALSSEPTAVTPAAAPAAPAVAPTYSLFDYVKGRVQTVSHCFHVIPEDDSDTFTWQPNNLHVEGGKCGTLDCSFTMVDHAFTMGTCNPPEQAPCDNYMQRLRESPYVALESNLIKFKPKEGENVAPNIVFMDK